MQISMNTFYKKRTMVSKKHDFHHNYF